MAIIFISNTSSVPRAETIDVTESNITLGKNDSMQSWITSGETKESWNRFTSLVYITDKTQSEVAYLLEPLLTPALDDDGNFTYKPVYDEDENIIEGEQGDQIFDVLNNRKLHWAEPDPSNPFYQELFINGEVHVTHDQILPYLIERN